MKNHFPFAMTLLALAVNLSLIYSVQAQTGFSTNTSPMIEPCDTLYSIGEPLVIALTNGKVLVLSGYRYIDQSSVDCSTPQFYDPATGTWTKTPMSYRRLEYTATVLANGKVLVAGGESDPDCGCDPSITELFDPSTGTWTNTGALNFPRQLHTATLLPNGKVMVAGGVNAFGGSISASVEIYDPATGIWTTNGPLITPRINHTATLLPNGKVLIAGGQDASENELSSAELYDPRSGTATAIVLNNTAKLSSGAFQIGFSNAPGANFTALATTNLSLPFSNWTTLGSVTQISSGQYQFTDSQATNKPQRFYRVRSP